MVEAVSNSLTTDRLYKRNKESCLHMGHLHVYIIKTKWSWRCPWV